MIPIRLDIEGLYSYQKKQTIDFERLKQAELFGIFGTTGSGKSSILEAITFALYGKTERLSAREPGGTGYHMMNLKSNRLWIDFEFSSGKEEQDKYRITVESKRNKKHFDKTQPFSRKVYKWGQEDWLPIEQTDAEHIVGLSYDNFKRTIIIPQGKFQDFIQLKSTERSQMLQDIFGLSKYEMSRQLKALIGKNIQQQKTTQALLDQYAAVDKAVIEGEEQTVLELEKEQQSFITTLNSLKKEKEALEQLKVVFEKIEQTEQKLQGLQQQKAEVDRRQVQLDRYIECLNQFKSILDKHQESSQQLKEIESNLSQSRNTYDSLTTEVKTLDDTYASVEKSYQERDHILKEAEDFTDILKLKSLSTHILNLTERSEKGEKETANLEQQISSYEAQEKNLDQEIAQLRKELPNTQEILAVEQWFAQQKSLKEQLTWREQNREKNQLKILKAKKEKRQLLAKTNIDHQQYELPTDKIIAILEAEIQRIEQQQSSLRHQQQQLLLQDQLQGLADNLKVGHPCPLCGSTEHPAVVHGEDVEKEIKKLDREIDEGGKRVKVLQQVLPGLQQLAVQARELGAELKEQKAEEQQIQMNLEKHLAAFVWASYDPNDEKSFKEEIGKIQELQAKIENKEQQKQGLDNTLNENRQKLPHYRKRLDEYRMELSTKQGEFQSARQGIKSIQVEDHLHKSEQELHSKIASLKDAHSQLEITYQNVSNQLKEKKERIHILKGKIEASSEQQQRISRQLAQINQQIEAELSISEFKTIEEVKETLNLALNTQSEKEFIRAFDISYTETQTTLRDLKEQVEGRHFDKEAFERLSQDIAEKEGKLEVLSQQIGGKKEFIRNLKERLKQKQTHQKELNALNLRADNLKVMDSLFRGNGFVNFVSTVYLENLCAAANERFMKLSRNSLSLEVDDQNNFHVRDLLNGGKQRSIKTLSGGQTFQAALCLALALSDQVQQQAQASQNFFFLDEGFGSLDKNSLQMIFHTLKSLQKENRIVGIISHVEELQQEIQTYLHIENDVEVGSRVAGSWEE